MQLQLLTRGLTLTRGLALASAALALTVSSEAQVTFSVDWHSPTVGLPDSFTATPITEGDILASALGVPILGPLPVPGTAISAGPTGLGLGAWPTCVGHPGGTPCAVEVDALSYGTDFRMRLQAGGSLGDYLFSTDEFALGAAGPAAAPDMLTEVPCGDAATDVWINAAFMPPGPLPPFAAPTGHTGVIDGDGLLSCSGAVYPGTGLIEPTFPGFPNAGDNLDALDVSPVASGTAFPATGVFFSLDGVSFDILSGVPNSGSAGVHGFTGADILHTAAPGGPPVLWAAGPALGLNLAGGLDDLDALAIHDNGNGNFDPSFQPYDWMTGGRDMVLFSVRRGSPVIGMPDSIFGLPIEEGDILTTPLPTGAGGVSPFPGIFCAAENLGLITARSFGALSDDLNALDTVNQPPTSGDCNGNGIADSTDIASGTSSDINSNGVPDDCELIATSYCFCPAGAGAPCGNTDPNAGCRNSTGVGALLSASGTSSGSNDDLVLTVTNMPTGQFGIVFMANSAVGPFPFGDGLRCAAGAVIRLGLKNSGVTGSISYGPGLIGAGLPVLPFETKAFQGWYRDPTGPCGNAFNLTNGIQVTFTP